jgi:hypothetical protein
LWTPSGYGSIGFSEVRGVEATEASGSDFTGVTVPRASPSNVRGEGMELGASGRGGKSGTQSGGISSGSLPSIGSFAFSLHLEVAAHPSYHNPTSLFQTGP